MNITTTDNSVTLHDVGNFIPEQVFECGQCFRWNKTETDSYVGVAFDKVIEIKSSHNNITLFNTNLQEFNEIWQKYFDFSRDYSEILKQASSHEIICKAAQYGSGIRILRQNLFETTISFIISASNNIPRIKQIVENLCKNFGKEITYNGQLFYSFPDFKSLDGITEEDLAPIRSGFRAKYIVDAVKRANSGLLDFEYIDSAPTDEGRKMLLEVKGIGEKVADCILLFGAGKFDVFPVDTWIDKAMRALYPEKCTNLKTTRLLGRELFGENCGMIQQYLFFYARENKIF